MSRSRSTTPGTVRSEAESDAALTGDLVDLGRRSGLAAVGVAAVEVFTDTRRVLVERRARGLAAGMQFTYRNPERSTDPARIVPGARALVVGALSYGDGGPDSVHAPSTRRPPASPGSGVPHPQGRVARYARHDHYARLRDALAPMALHLESLGWRAAVVCDDNALVDRAAAHRAGLGWYGKNTLFFLDGLGSWFVLGSVVTDAPLRPSSAEPQPHGSGCGTCARCRAACPTGALSEPGVVDARRCLAWLVQAPGSFPEEFRSALGDRLYGCDECQQVCPVNRLADRGHQPERPEPDGTAHVDVLTLLASSDDDLMAAHGRWYIAHRDPRYLRRNALVVLGNTGDGRDPSTEATLLHWLGVDDPMLAEHARWAARALGRADLVDRAS
ncbi:MAG TPA: tRNA epoxyqueuosine(34) reductase QueG [Acidimicrobiales bacterium]|nr:tRNA epoxyqueuosine(34) reductase QueG [Acidimicrobiales bacterium]